MSRTYPMQCVGQFKAGQPWGPRNTATGTPLTGTAQNDLLTMLGTPIPIQSQTFQSVLSGSPNNGDIATLSPGGAGGGPYAVTVAGYIADVWDCTVATPQVGGTAHLTIGANVYSYAVHLGETANDVAIGVAAQAAADFYYTVTAPGLGVVHCVAKVPGLPLAALSTSVTGTGTTTFAAVNTTPGADGDSLQDVVTALVLAAAGDTVWTITDAGGLIIQCVHQVAGVTADVVASSYAAGLFGFGTFLSQKIVNGAAANTYAVTDQTATLFSYAVHPADTLADVATGLAAVLAGSYTVTPVGDQIWVSGVAGAAFALTDTSVNNTPNGGSVAVRAVTSASATILPGSPGVVSTTNVASLTLWSELLSGTSYDVNLWVFDPYVGAWYIGATTTISGTLAITYDVSSLPYVFLSLSNFVGAGVALNTIMGDRLTPGFQG